MPMHHYPGRSPLYASNAEAPERYLLWLLRLLAPLGAHRTFIQSHGLNGADLARMLSRDYWLDDDEAFWPASESLQKKTVVRDRDGERIATEYDPKRVRDELLRMHRDAERDLSSSSVPEPLNRNLIRLAAFFELTEVDVRLLEFIVVLNCDTLLSETTEWLGQLSTSQLFQALAVVLGRPENQIRAALSSFIHPLRAPAFENWLSASLS